MTQFAYFLAKLFLVVTLVIAPVATMADHSDHVACDHAPVASGHQCDMEKAPKCCTGEQNCTDGFSFSIALMPELAAAAQVLTSGGNTLYQRHYQTFILAVESPPPII